MDNVFTIPSTIGPPNAKRAPESITVPHGQGVIIDMCARGYDGHPLPNPEDHDFYLAVSRSADGAPLEEWHIGDPQVSMIDPAKSITRFRLRFADLAPYLQEGVSFRFDGWSQRIQPELEDPVRHVQGTITLGPSILGQRQPFFDLTSVGFNDLLGPVSDNVYLVDLRTGFKGGKLPIEYSASAGGIVNNTLVLSREAAVSRAVTVTATDGRNDEAVADFQQITYAPLVFGTLADVTETQEANGTIDISLSVGFTGGYGNRVYEADRGTVNGSVLTLSLDQVFAGAVTVSATDEDANVATGSFQFTVQAAATAPADITLSATTLTEDATPGSTVGVLSSDGEGVAFALVSDPSGYFAVDGSSLVVASGVTLSAGSYSVEISATNEGGSVAETFGIVVEAVIPEPSVVRIAGGMLGAVPDGTARTDTLVVASFSSYPNDPIAPSTSFTLQGTGGAGNIQVQAESDGVVRAIVRYYLGETATVESAIAGAPAGTVSTGDEVVIIAIAGGGWLDLRLSVNGGEMFLIPPVAIAADARFAVHEQSWAVGNYFGAGSIVQEMSGGFVWAMDGKPAVTSEDLRARVVSPGGRLGPVAELEATFGVPKVAVYGALADWIVGGVGQNRGSGANFTSVYQEPTFEDVVIEEPASGSGLIATTSSDVDLLAGTYSTASDLLLSFFDPPDEDLASRLTLTVNRASVMLGEAVFLKIIGLTKAEAATWQFLWEFDSVQLFDFTGDLPAHMSDSNHATGHHQAIAWADVDGPGIKTVTVRVVPPIWSGRKGMTLTVDVENRDPDVVFANDTWVVVPSGVVETSPTGTVVSTIKAAHDAVLSNGGGRIRLHSGSTHNWPAAVGETYESRVFENPTMEGILIDSWGSTGEHAKVHMNQGFTMTKACSPDFYVLVQNIEMYGDYDPTTGEGIAPTPLSFKGQFHLTAHGCKFHGVYDAILENSDKGTPNIGTIASWTNHITRWENYGCYVQNIKYLLFRGNSICQDPNAINGYEAKEPDRIDDNGNYTPNYPDHGPLRFANADNSFVVFSQNRCFSCTGWTSWSGTTDGSPINVRAHQAILRLGSSTAAGLNALINDNWTEGGGYSLHGGSSNRVLGRADMIVLRDNYMLATANRTEIRFGHSDVWFHNNVYVRPDVLQEDTVPPYVFSYDDAPGGGVTSDWHLGKIRIFNNSIAYMLSAANHPSLDKIPSRDWIMKYQPGPWEFKAGHPVPPSGYPEMIERDNIVWSPNVALDGGGADNDGMRSAGVLGPVPLYTAKRQEQADGTVWVNTAYATPADASILPVLDATSALRGTASVIAGASAAATDSLGRYCTATPDPGAVQSTVLVEG